MKVLDLFSGLGGWSQAFVERGHQVTTVDINPIFKPTIVVDIINLIPKDLGDEWDIILASPPCNCFSVGTIYRYWKKKGTTYYPQHQKVINAINLIKHTLYLINSLNPKFWILENPRAMLRIMPFMNVYKRETISLCQYGDIRMKPTDLWGKFPPTLKFRPMCKPNSPCHEKAPRGSRTGTQKLKGSAMRAFLPRELSLDVCIAIEKYLENPKQALINSLIGEEKHIEDFTH